MTVYRLGSEWQFVELVPKIRPVARIILAGLVSNCPHSNAREEGVYAYADTRFFCSGLVMMVIVTAKCNGEKMNITTFVMVGTISACPG